MPVHESEALPYHILSDESVRIEQQHIFALRLPYGDVVRPRETEVVVACHEVDLREGARNDVYGVIFRVIVNDIHLGVYVLQRAPQAAEALLKIMPDVITYYYNR